MLEGSDDTSQTNEGPRIDDLKIQISSYGTAVPEVYGGMRLAGNVFWLRDNQIDETKTTTTNTQEQPKGLFDGPEHTTTTITYTYSARFAVLLCRGPITGISRIWWNGKKVWDRRAGKISGDLPIQIYTGAETQTTNSLMEEALGVGEVPAYRGYAYIVFNDIDLADGGNTIGNWEFEVVKSGAVAPLPIVLLASNPDFYVNYATIVEDPVTQLFWTAAYRGGLAYLEAWDTDAEQVVLSVPTGINEVVTGIEYQPAVTIAGLAGPLSIPARIWCAYGSVLPANYISVHDATTGELVVALTNPSWISHQPIWDPVGNVMVIHRVHFGSFARTWNPFTFVYSDEFGDFPSLERHGMFISGYNYMAYLGENGMLTLLAAGSYAKIYEGGPSSWWFSIATNTQIAYDPTRGRIWCGSALGYGSGFGYFDLDTFTWIQTTVNWFRGGVFYHPGLDAIVVRPQNAGDDDPGGTGISWNRGYIVLLDAGTGKVRSAITAQDPVWPDRLYHSTLGGNVYILEANGTGFVKSYLIEGVDSNAIPIKDIVEDVCEKVGFHDTEINASELTETVDGYILPRAMTGRAAIEGLTAYGFFGSIESDTKLEFPKRTGAVIRSLTEDDILISDSGDMSSDNDYFMIRRIEETALPRELSIKHVNPALHYQQSAQRARRIITRTENIVSRDMAIAMTDSVAKQKANALLDVAWIERDLYDFKLSYEDADIEPLDSINVTLDGTVYEMIVEGTSHTPGNSLAVKAKSRNSAAYTNTSTASTPDGLPDDVVATRTARSKLFLADIPLLVDEHSNGNGGFYVFTGRSVAGFSWNGANVYRSSDNLDWNLGTSVLDEVEWGTVKTNGLVNQDAWNVADKGTLSIIMGNGTLSSVTDDEIAAGKNGALFDDEVIQYKTATLEGDGSYTLSGVVRARRGTDAATRHEVVGARFLKLNHPIISLQTDPQDRGNTYYHHAVTLTLPFGSGEIVPFANSEARLKPYAPVQVVGVWDSPSTDDIRLTWEPRTRVGAQRLPNGVTVNDAEATEEYEVDIIDPADDTTVLRAFTALVSPTVDYTSAMQTTDSGGAQDFIIVDVYKISATVGRGFSNRAWLMKTGTDSTEEDFGGMTAGIAPTGWTNIWTTPSTFQVTAEAGVTGGKYLEMISTGNAEYCSTIDGSDLHPTREMLVRWRPGNAQVLGSPYATGPRFYIRAGGVTTPTNTQDGYFLQMSLRLEEYWLVTYKEGGAFIQDYPENSAPLAHTLSPVIAVGDWVWLRLRAEGYTMKSKVWRDVVGVPEPPTWQAQITDNRGPLNGLVGVGFQNNLVELDIDSIRVAYGGPHA